VSGLSGNEVNIVLNYVFLASCGWKLAGSHSRENFAVVVKKISGNEDRWEREKFQMLEAKVSRALFSVAKGESGTTERV